MSNLTVKVSEKGAVSVIGMGRFPVTLYASQWERLIGNPAIVKGILAFIEAKRKEKREDGTPVLADKSTAKEGKNGAVALG